MAIRRISPQLISNASASDGDVLQYIDANAKVEWVSAGSGGNSNLIQDNLVRLEANVSSNTDTVSDNVSSASANITALNANVNIVSPNVDSYATYANATFSTGYASFTKVDSGAGNVVANVTTDTLTFIAGNNISISANTLYDEISFAFALSNAVNNYFIADGTTNTFTLTQSAKSNEAVLVSIEGLLQSPNLHYQVSSTTLTLMNTLPIDNGAEIAVRWIPNTEENVPGAPSTPTTAFTQGDTYGYVLGGGIVPHSDVIEKYPYASDSPATDVAEMTTTSAFWGDTYSSSTHGYKTGDFGGAKFPFSSDASATTIGSLRPSGPNTPPSFPADSSGGVSAESYGYGFCGNLNTGGPAYYYKFPFSSDVVGSDVGTVNPDRVIRGACVSSLTSGYRAGGDDSGFSPDPTVKTSFLIEKFPFSSDTNTTSVGELTYRVALNQGSQSPTNGYSLGGRHPEAAGPNVDYIQKWPFSSDTPASDVAELTGQTAYAIGQGSQSTTNGYHGVGGPTYEVIQKFPFSSDAPASDVGEATAGKAYTNACYV